MTARLSSSMADDRLDRLVAGLLAERGEDVASVALPANAMAERIAGRLGPAQQARASLVLVGAVILLLVAIVAAAVVGFRPRPPAPLTPVTYECVPVPQQGGFIDQFSVRDETGLVTGCRELAPDEALAIRARFGPPLASFDGVTAEVSKASPDSRRLLVIWMQATCVLTARLQPTGFVAHHMTLEVGGRPDPRCTPGSGPRAVELALGNPMSPSNVSALTGRECSAEPRPYLLAVRDEVGILAGCREVVGDEAAAMWEAFGTPETMHANSLEITSASADDTRLVVIWVIANCDGNAELVLTENVPNRLDIVATQEEVGVCAPGSCIRAVELTFYQPIAPHRVSGKTNRVLVAP